MTVHVARTMTSDLTYHSRLISFIRKALGMGGRREGKSATHCVPLTITDSAQAQLHPIPTSPWSRRYCRRFPSHLRDNKLLLTDLELFAHPHSHNLVTELRYQPRSKRVNSSSTARTTLDTKQGPPGDPCRECWAETVSVDPWNSADFLLSFFYAFDKSSLFKVIHIN